MERLPMVPESCSLDHGGAVSQLARYRAAGAGATVVHRETRSLILRLDEAVAASTVDDLIAVERGCCPFFDLGWNPDKRILSVAVSRAEHEPALDAVAHAFGLSLS